MQTRNVIAAFLWKVLATVVVCAPDMSILWPEFVKEDGRSINVTCRLTDNDQCHAGTWFELYDNRTTIVLARKPCQADIRDRAVFPVTLKENTPFGQFRCRYGGKAISSNALQISYRFCSDDSRSCQQSSTCDSDAEMKFCVAHKNGISVCSKITDRDWCIAEERRSVFKFCPIQQRSLCSAIFHNYQAVWFKMYHTDGSCPYGVMQAPVRYMGIGRLYDEPFVVSTEEKTIVVQCSEGGPFFSQNVYLTAGQYNATKMCIHYVNFTLSNDLFQEGAVVHDAQVIINRYFFLNRLVFLGARLNLSEYDSNQLRCELLTQVTEEFRVVQWWTRKSNGSVRFDENTQRGPLEAGHSWILKTDIPDEYQCHMTITYKSCSPHRKFVQTLTSDWMLVSASEKLTGHRVMAMISVLFSLNVVYSY